ncbi:MAG: DegV family protein [Coriobacteriia bacterium]|nr:DegV family protein [Coriobacteriia bacterium]
MIRVITDSTSSISAQRAEELGVQVVSLFVNHNGVEYQDATMDLDAFYAEIHTMLDNIPRSSQPSQLALETVFEDAAKAGDQVLGLFMSSGLSGTFEGALRAARSVKARNADFTFALVDTQSCGYDEGWPVEAGATARNNGASLEECVDAVVRSVESTRFLFCPESLTFLQKGGRIGRASALLGNLIKLTPVLTVRDGTVLTAAKVRTQKKAMDAILDLMQADAQAHGLRNIKAHYIGDKTPAVKWAEKKIGPLVGHDVDVVPVSPVVGLHVGPAVGIAYECDEPIEGKMVEAQVPVVFSASC